MASFRTSSPELEMVSLVVRFVSWLPRGRNNAAIADMGSRVASFANGRIADVRVNPRRRAARTLSW